MSDWLKNIQKTLSSKDTNWGGLLGSAALGGLAGALLGSKSVSKAAKQILLVGGGAAAGAFAWDRYKKYMQQSSETQEAPLTARVERIVLALVFAAKADGHIDPSEQRAIQEKISELGVDSNTETLIEKAINQPLDPVLVAKGVENEQEALEIYFVSRSVIDLDHFMERSYLDALAQALCIPAPAREAIEADLSAASAASKQ